MKQFCDLLGSQGVKGGADALIDEKTVFFLLEKVVESIYGKKGKENILPESFTKGTLSIFVYKSLWFTEVSLEKKSLMDAINSELGKAVIESIHVKRK